jgi:protein SCO1/2
MENKKMVGLAPLDPPYIPALEPTAGNTGSVSLLKREQRRGTRTCVLWRGLFNALLLSGLLCTSLLAEDRKESNPKEAQDVGLVPHLGASLPRDLPFTDAEGNAVTLGQFFDGKRPVILTMNYSNCPKLCSLQLNGLLTGLTRMAWNIGEQFQIVTVSLDPKESVQRAAQSKEKYLRIYERADRSEGWHWLVSRDDRNIKAVADAVGFRYKFDPVRQLFAHPAVAIICSPDGRVMRYLNGIQYDPQTLRLALVEASQGKMGTWVDEIVLRCFEFDETSGSYAFSALIIMRVGGAITLFALVGLLVVLWRRDRKRWSATRLPTLSAAALLDKPAAAPVAQSPRDIIR